MRYRRKKAQKKQHPGRPFHRLEANILITETLKDKTITLELGKLVVKTDKKLKGGSFFNPKSVTKMVTWNVRFKRITIKGQTIANEMRPYGTGTWNF